MAGLPEKVRDALDRLKEQNTGPHFLVVRKINGRYYVYKELRPWDERKKTWKTVSEYLGRITDDGAFVRKKGSKEDELENAKAIIEAHGGKVTLPEKEEGQKIEMVLTPDETDRKILTILSMNARATLPFIAKRVGLSVSAVDNRIRQLEKRYGIKYIAEIDVEKLGYLKFIILVKFLDRIPAAEDIIKAVKVEPRVQLAIRLSGGDYNLLIYVLAETNQDVNYMVRDIMRNNFLDYKMQLYITPFYESYSFVPLRDEFIDTFRNQFQKKKSVFEEELTEKRRMLLEREFAVFRELNNHGKENFTSIDKKYSFDNGRSQYTYNKLLGNMLLKRTTLTMHNLPFRYVAIIFIKDVNLVEVYTTRKPLLQSIIKETKTWANQYALVGDIGAPYGILLFLPIFTNGELNVILKELSTIKGISIETSIATDILIGNLCYRRFDNAYARQQRILVEEYGLRPLPKITYG